MVWEVFIDMEERLKKNQRPRPNLVLQYVDHDKPEVTASDSFCSGCKKIHRFSINNDCPTLSNSEFAAWMSLWIVLRLFKALRNRLNCIKAITGYCICSPWTLWGRILISTGLQLWADVTHNYKPTRWCLLRFWGKRSRSKSSSFMDIACSKGSHTCTSR